jgi:hypothetical protein
MAVFGKRERPFLAGRANRRSASNGRYRCTTAKVKQRMKNGQSKAADEELVLDDRYGAAPLGECRL